MTFWMEALTWLVDPQSWMGASGILARTGQHLAVSLIAVFLAAVIIMPVAIVLGHRRTAGHLIWMVTAAARSVPTVGLLTLLALLLGIGLYAPLLALTVLAIPSLLAGTFTGIRDVDATLVDAMRGNGMSETALILNVELPLAAPVILGGMRNAVLQVSSTATLAAYTADLGLGRFIFAGLKSSNYALMLAGAILVTALSFLLDLVFGYAQRQATRRACPS